MLAPMLVIALVTVLALWPVVTFDFSIWDDNDTITGNPHINPPTPGAPTLAGLAYHWTHFAGELYVPVTYTTWWLLAQVARVDRGDGTATLNPWIFHAANLLLHVIAACVTYRLLARVLSAGTSPDRARSPNTSFPAIAGALVFAIHPVQVESVAWVSGTKDLLAGLFTLIALERYVAHASEINSSRPYFCSAWSLLAFGAAMLSKPTAAAMPLIAAVIDVMIRGRSPRVVARAIAPYLLLAVPVFVVGKFAQPASMIDPIPLWWRPFVALDAIGYYAFKIVWPARLGLDYGRSPPSVIASGAAFVTSAAVLAVGGTLYALLGRHRRRVGAALAVVGAALLPVLGFVPFEFQQKSTTADHYLYVAMLGVAMLITTVLADRSCHRIGAFCCSIALVMSLGVRSWAQTWYWRDSRVLFEHAIDVNPNSRIGPFNLVFYWLGQGRPDLAEPYARRMMELTPDDPWSYLHLATTLAEQHRVVEAEQLFRTAAARWPNNAEAHRGLGLALLDLGRPREAVEELDTAIRLGADFPALRAARGRAAAGIPSTIPSGQ